LPIARIQLLVRPNPLTIKPYRRKKEVKPGHNLTEVLNLLSFFFLLLLLGALVLPVRFHLHLHGRGNTFFFFVEMSLTNWRFLNRTFFLTLESPERPETPGEETPVPAPESREADKKKELPAAPGLVPEAVPGLIPGLIPGLSPGLIPGLVPWLIPGLFPVAFSQVYKLLGHYGVGGTLLYLFLPPAYRRWLTVTQHLEKRGKFSRFRWGTIVGGNDAALTGVTAGFLWGVKESLLRFFLGDYRFGPEGPRIVILPRFKTPGWETMLDCIFAVQVGHIILAGVKGIIYSMMGGERHGGPPD
jgi:hypothetical protein